MAFPSNPVNNQQTTVNNITYYYNSTKSAWIRLSNSGSANLSVNTVTTSGNITVGQYIFQSGATVPYASTIILNDVSPQCNGLTSVFNLMLEQNTINTIVDSKDLDVFVNGLKIAPYVQRYTFPWLMNVESNGFKVITQPNIITGQPDVGKVVIYKAPPIGSTVSLTLTNTSASKQTTRYPFNAATVALGD
jgi:hypothetical protein